MVAASGRGRELLPGLQGSDRSLTQIFFCQNYFTSATIFSAYFFGSLSNFPLHSSQPKPTFLFSKMLKNSLSTSSPDSGHLVLTILRAVGFSVLLAAGLSAGLSAGFAFLAGVSVAAPGASALMLAANLAGSFWNSTGHLSQQKPTVLPSKAR